MSQIVAQELVAEVAEVAVVPAKKLSLKMKKMMMSEIPATTKKIEMDLPQSDIGSVNQQASQMSQEFNQYGSIEMNWFNAVGEESVVAEEVPAPAVPEVKKISTIRPRAKKSKVSVPPAPAPVPVAVVQDVAEILAEIVENALAESEKQEKIKETAWRLMEEKKAKAKASREKTKAKKLALAVAQVAQVADSEDEEGEGKEDGEYERSTAKRPIQKEKEGRVLKGRISAVEKKMKKELKLLKTPLAELIKKAKNAEEIEEKREELIQEKKSATSRVHHAIAQEFNTSVVVARRSEEGRGEKVRKPLKLKEKTASKLFWANCQRVLPHFVENFTTFAEAKKTYADVENWCFADESNEDFTVEKRKESYGKFHAIFKRATKALVSDNCQHLKFYADATCELNPSLVLANHLSAQGIYVVRRTEKTLVLRSSRDELIEIGNSNEVMTRDDLLFNEQNRLVQAVGHNVLRKLCGAVVKKVAEHKYEGHDYEADEAI